jgi:hypothetical protein
LQPHYGLGVVPGALFGMLRGRAPLIGWGRGLLYGALLYARNDEYFNTALGLVAHPRHTPPRRNPGLDGHLARESPPTWASTHWAVSGSYAPVQ